MSEVLLVIFRLNVKHVNQHLHVAKDVFSLRSKVVFHKGFLASTIPQIQHQIAQKTNVAVFNVDRDAQTHRVTSDVVGKNNRPHRRLATARFAHQQNLLERRKKKEEKKKQKQNKQNKKQKNKNKMQDARAKQGRSFDAYLFLETTHRSNKFLICAQRALIIEHTSIDVFDDEGY